jgi:two-component system sensor histidine kinase KdpD
MHHKLCRSFGDILKTSKLETCKDMGQEPNREAALPATPGQKSPRPESWLVCVSPSPLSHTLIRAIHRLAEAQQVKWFALYVETPAHARLPLEDQERVSQTLRLATQLGAQTVKLSGFRIGDEILDFARERQVSRIFVGKPYQRRWRRFFGASLVDYLIWNCGSIDVYVISGEAEEAKPAKTPWPKPQPQWANYALAGVGVGLCTALAYTLFPYLRLTSVAMMYLVTVVIIASSLGRGPAVLSSFFSVVLTAYFFVPEYFSFAVTNTEYAITLAVMLVVSTLISGLTARTRYQATVARQQERQAAALFEMSQNLTARYSLDALLWEAAEQISRIFQVQVAILLPDQQKLLTLRAGDPIRDYDVTEKIVAGWVFRHGHLAGAGTGTLPNVKGIYLPLKSSRQVIGVLRLELNASQRQLDSESLRLLEALANQVALAIEREELVARAQTAQVQMEAEKMRNILLSTVSHDLRTPLTVIAGAASSLLEGEGHLDGATKHEFAQTIYEEAKRLDRVVHNLLEMSRLQSEEFTLHSEWHVLEEVIGCALAQLDSQLQDRPVHISLPTDLPLVKIDALLMERVFVNLLENAAKHTPAGIPIDITVRIAGRNLRVEVADGGPGLPAGQEEKIFEKFYQVWPGRTRGAGLGLTICRSVIEAHGGRIWAANRPDGGAAFHFSIPLEEESPLDEYLPDEAAHPAH